MNFSMPPGWNTRLEQAAAHSAPGWLIFETNDQISMGAEGLCLSLDQVRASHDMGAMPHGMPPRRLPA